MAENKTSTSSTNLDIDSGKGRSTQSAFDLVESELLDSYNYAYTYGDQEGSPAPGRAQTVPTPPSTISSTGKTVTVPTKTSLQDACVVPTRTSILQTRSTSLPGVVPTETLQAISLQDAHSKPRDAHTEDLKEKLKTLEKKNFNLEKTLAIVCKDKDDLKRDVEDLNQKLIERKEEYSAKEQECAQLKEEIRCLKEEIKKHLTTIRTIRIRGLNFEYDHVKKLGAGSFGVVHLMKNKLDDHQYAVKLIWLPDDEKERKECLQEAEKFARLNHEHVVRYHYARKETAPFNWKEVPPWSSLLDINETLTCNGPPTCLVIFMEYCEKGTLKSWLQENSQRSSRCVMEFFQQIVEGLCYIHANEITHGDLTLANIFVNAKGIIKIGDIGRAKYWPSQEGRASRFRDGTPPQWCKNASMQKTVDIYELGVCLLRMMNPAALEDNEFLKLCKPIVNYLQRIYESSQRTAGSAVDTKSLITMFHPSFINSYYNIAKLIATLLWESMPLNSFISDARMLFEGKHEKLLRLAYDESDHEEIIGIVH